MSRLEALQEKPWYLQLAAFGVVALVLYVGFWYFVTSGTRAETADLTAKADKLRGENAAAQIAQQRLNEFRATYERVKSEYADLEALLPEQRELTMVLQNIQDRARGRLSVRKFAPKDDEQQDFYSSKLVEVGVSGNYNNLGSFFSQMAAYQRIVSITDFKFTAFDRKKSEDKDQMLRGRTVNAEFKLKAYYASPERVQNAQPAAGAAAGKPGGEQASQAVAEAAAKQKQAAAAAAK
ncbi:MAG TPA: type 4a pilus biogenesis protein PilO [Pyrinomonadaceae bacterium]|nr:type 4a pilus biogenesis protein PilO [Pyrinomonadaceae bacterium]